MLPVLGIEGASLASAAPYRRAKTKVRPGVQVDLLLQTKSTAYVIEVKRRERIGEEIATEIGKKVEALGFRSGVAVRTALVYDGNLAPSIRTDHLVDFIIPAERLFS